MSEYYADIPGKNPFVGFDILTFSESVIARYREEIKCVRKEEAWPDI